MWGYSDQEKSNMEGFFLKFESADILFHKYYLTPDTRLDRFFCNKSWKDYHNWYICKRVLQHTNTTNFKQLLFFFFNRYCTICTRFNIKSLHYGLSPIEKGDVKNFAKWVPWPPFLFVKIVSDKKYLGKTFWSVSLSFIYLVWIDFEEQWKVWYFYTFWGPVECIS